MFITGPFLFAYVDERQNRAEQLGMDIVQPSQRHGRGLGRRLAPAHEEHHPVGHARDHARLAMPVHVIFGTRDRTVRPRHTEALVKAIPQGRLTWIADGGHVVMEEVPAFVNAQMLDDLTRFPV